MLPPNSFDSPCHPLPTPTGSVRYLMWAPSLPSLPSPPPPPLPLATAANFNCLWHLSDSPARLKAGQSRRTRIFQRPGQAPSVGCRSPAGPNDARRHGRPHHRPHQRKQLVRCGSSRRDLGQPPLLGHSMKLSFLIERPILPYITSRGSLLLLLPLLLFLSLASLGSSSLRN